MDSHKILAIEISATVFVAPIIGWLALYVAAPWGSLGLRPVLPWLRVLRWAAWGLAIALSVAYLADNHFPFIYGLAMSSFSSGLALPESWVKRRFAPDLIDPVSPNGWWPNKRE